MKKLTSWDYRMMTPQQRFLSKIDKHEGGCWIWTGTRSKPWMYGQFYINNKPVWAHRFSYEFHKGPITKGLFVLHSCDKPSCVNPEHLSLGTARENIKDMREKGRQNDFGRKGKGKPRRVSEPDWIDPRKKVHSKRCYSVVGVRDRNRLIISKDLSKVTCGTCLRVPKIQQAKETEK